MVGEAVFGDEFEAVPAGLQFELDGLDKRGMPGDGRSGGICATSILFVKQNANWQITGNSAPVPSALGLDPRGSEGLRGDPRRAPPAWSPDPSLQGALP
jgi:hypothetical protein